MEKAQYKCNTSLHCLGFTRPIQNEVILVTGPPCWPIGSAPALERGTSVQLTRTLSPCPIRKVHICYSLRHVRSRGTIQPLGNKMCASAKMLPVRKLSGFGRDTASLKGRRAIALCARHPRGRKGESEPFPFTSLPSPLPPLPPPFPPPPLLRPFLSSHFFTPSHDLLLVSSRTARGYLVPWRSSLKRGRPPE